MDRCRITTGLLLLAAMLLVGAVAPARAQLENPVYVDDSPRAWELFQRARDQTTENAGEAVRLYQELLDGYALRVIPVHEATRDHFVAVRTRVLEDLLADDDLLERYRVMQAPEAQRLLDEGAVHEVAMTRSLTDAGLDATLRLGQLALESARFRAALTWLEQAERHPDLGGRRAAHWWLMRGMAWHYLGRSVDAAAALERLEMMGGIGADCATLLAGLTEHAHARPAIGEGVTPLDTAETTQLTDLVAQQIWSEAMPDTLFRRRYEDPATLRTALSPTAERRRDRGELTTMAPTVDESVVYINEGYTVHALDRFTGRGVWSRPHVEEPASILDIDNESTGDLNLIAVRGGRIVTIMGHAYSTKRSGAGQLICLDAEDGSLHWQQSLDRIGGDEEYEGLFPHGKPIILEGRAYVLARKVTRQNLTSCYLVALDLETGELDWIRHIASSGGRTREARPFSSPVHDAGDLLVATAVGAIACVDASTGLPRWVRRSNVPLGISDRAHRPWELGGPVVVDDRVIAITPDQQRIVALDRRTGDQLSQHDASRSDRWGEPAYLLANDGFVYGIGREIRAFAADALDALSWSIPAREIAEAEDGSAFYRAELMLAGRVQLVDGALVVPNRRGVLLLHEETGETLHELPIERVGNPVALDAQLVLAGADAIDVYMSFGRAEQMLRARLAGAPDDPEPATSMLQLGLRAGDLALTLEAARLALDVIERAPARPANAAARRDVFEMLLEAHESGMPSTRPEGEAFYAIMRDVAATPAQRVDYLLASSVWREQFDPPGAVDTLQQVLDDPTLANESRDVGPVRRAARHWAGSRIAALIEEHGLEVYASHADAARRALDALVGGAEPAAIATIESIAVRYPFADAGVEAALIASGRFEKSGDRRAALATLARAYHLLPSGERAERLLGRFVALIEESGDRAHAAAVLNAISTNHPGLTLAMPGGTRSIEAWHERLSSTDRTPLAQLGATPDVAEMLDGRLLPTTLTHRPTRLPRRALLIDGDQLRALTPDGLETIWRIAVDDENASLLAADDDRALLWTGASIDDPRVVAIDMRVGRTLWRTQRVSDLIAQPLGRSGNVAQRMPNELPFDPRETLPLLGRETIVLAQRTGGVVAFDRETGAVRWSVDQTLQQVHLAQVHEFGVVLAGLGRPIGARGRALEPRVLVLDTESGGELRHMFQPATDEGLIWMDADPMGSLLCASADGLELFDLLTGERRWENTSFEAIDTRSGACVSGYGVIESRTSTLASVRLESGELGDPFETADRGAWDATQLERMTIVDGTVVALYRRRLVRYEPDGTVIGADVITDPNRDYRLVLAADDRLIVVSQDDIRQVEDESGGRRTQRFYRLYVLTGSAMALSSIELPPTSTRLRDVAAIDGWLLLSTGDETLAIPLPTTP